MLIRIMNKNSLFTNVMKRLKLLLSCSALVACLMVLFTGCAVAKAANTSAVGNRTLKIDKTFSGISANTLFEIEYIANDTEPDAVLTGAKDVIDNVSWNVNSHGMLSFSYTGKPKSDSDPHVHIRLNGPVLKTLEASNAGVIKVVSPMNVEHVFNVSASSGGMVILMKTVKGSDVVNLIASSGGIITCGETISGMNVVNLEAKGSQLGCNEVNGHTVNLRSSTGSTMKTGRGKGRVLNLTCTSGASIDMIQCNVTQLNLDASLGSELIVENCTASVTNVVAASGSSIEIKGYTDKVSFVASSAAEINATHFKYKTELMGGVTSGASLLR